MLSPTPPTQSPPSKRRVSVYANQQLPQQMFVPEFYKQSSSHGDDFEEKDPHGKSNSNKNEASARSTESPPSTSTRHQDKQGIETFFKPTGFGTLSTATSKEKLDEIAEHVDSDFEMTDDDEDDDEYIERHAEKKFKNTTASNAAKSTGYAKGNKSNTTGNKKKKEDHHPSERRYSEPLHAIMQGAVPAYQIVEEAFERHTAEKERTTRQFSGYNETSTTTTFVKNQQSPLGYGTVARKPSTNIHQLDQQQVDEMGSGSEHQHHHSLFSHRGSVETAKGTSMLVPPPASHSQSHLPPPASPASVSLTRAASMMPNHGAFVVNKPSSSTTHNRLLMNSSASFHQNQLNRAASFNPFQMAQQEKNMVYGSSSAHSQHALQPYGSHHSSGALSNPFASTSPQMASLSAQSSTVTAVRSTRELETIEQLTRNQHEYAIMMSLEARQEYVRDFFRRKIGWTSASASLQRAEGLLRSQIEESCLKFYPRMKKASQSLIVERVFELNENLEKETNDESRHISSDISVKSKSEIQQQRQVWIPKQLFEAESTFRNELLAEYDLVAPRIAITVAELYERAEMHSAFSIVFKRFKLEHKALFKRQELIAKTWSGITLKYVKEQQELHERQAFRTFNLRLQLFHFECTEMITRKMLLDAETTQRNDTIIRPEEVIAKLISEKRKLHRSLQAKMPMPWNVFCERWEITHKEEVPERSLIEAEERSEMFDLVIIEFERLRREQIEFHARQEIVNQIQHLLNDVKEAENEMSVIVLSHAEDDDDAWNVYGKDDNTTGRDETAYKSFVGTPIVKRKMQRSFQQNKQQQLQLRRNTKDITNPLELINRYGNDENISFNDMECSIEHREFYSFIERCLQQFPCCHAKFFHDREASKKKKSNNKKMFKQFGENNNNNNVESSDDDSDDDSSNDHEQQKEQHLVMAVNDEYRRSLLDVSSPSTLLKSATSLADVMIDMRENSTSASSSSKQHEGCTAYSSSSLIKSSSSTKKQEQKKKKKELSIFFATIRTLIDFERIRREEIEFFHRMHFNALRWFDHGLQQYNRRGFFALPSTAPYLAIDGPRLHQTSKSSNNNDSPSNSMLRSASSSPTSPAKGTSNYSPFLAVGIGNSDNNTNNNNDGKSSPKKQRRTSFIVDDNIINNKSCSPNNNNIPTSENQSSEKKKTKIRRLSQQPMEIPQLSAEALRAVAAAKETKDKLQQRSGSNNNGNTNLNSSSNNLLLRRSASSRGDGENASVSLSDEKEQAGERSFSSLSPVRMTSEDGFIPLFGSSSSFHHHHQQQPESGLLVLQLWRQVEYKRKAISYFEQREFSQMMADPENFSFDFLLHREGDGETEDWNNDHRNNNNNSASASSSPMMLPLKEKMVHAIEQDLQRQKQLQMWNLEQTWMKRCNDILNEEVRMRTDLLGWSSRGEYRGPFTFSSGGQQHYSDKNSRSSNDQLQHTDDVEADKNSSMRNIAAQRNSGGIVLTRTREAKNSIDDGTSSASAAPPGEFTEDFVVAVMSAMGSHDVSASWSSMMMAFC